MLLTSARLPRFLPFLWPTGHKKVKNRGKRARRGAKKSKKSKKTQKNPKKGKQIQKKRVKRCHLLRFLLVASEAPRTLTDEQQVAIDIFKDQPNGGGLLLWGITGSGKTEVYLQLAADELASGRHVLLLTPEIGLIPQLVDRCRRRFGSRVLEYHSGCTERERVRTWRDSPTSGRKAWVLAAAASRASIRAWFQLTVTATGSLGVAVWTGRVCRV